MDTKDNSIGSLKWSEKSLKKYSSNYPRPYQQECKKGGKKLGDCEFEVSLGYIMSYTSV